MPIDMSEVYTKVTAAKDFEVRGQDWIEDRYDGVPYKIVAGHSITIPPDAARHIFGCKPGESSLNDMFKHFSKRAGWNTPAFAELVNVGTEERPRRVSLAQATWGKLKFEAIVMQMTPVPLKELAKEDEGRSVAA